jgi:AcrR family transcriptional regulator
MAATGLRERKKAQTSEALQAAALRLFTEQGFDQTTVEEIADACEVSPRTFFRYFPSKQDVLFGDGEVRKAEMLAALANQPAGSTPLAAVRIAIGAMVDEYEGERELLAVRMAIVSATQSLRSDKADRHRGFEDAVADALQTRAHTSGPPSLEIRLVATSAMAALRAALDTWLAGPPEASLHELVTEAFDRLAGGLA